jgi:hypothetical protein
MTESPGVIATLPPLPAPAAVAYPRSPVTGRPARPAAVLLAGVLYGLAIAVTALGYGRLWWDAASVERLLEAARVFRWAEPDPVSWQAVVLVIATALVVVIVVGCCGAVAYNAWQGRRWVRWGGLVALGVTGLTYLLNDWATAALAPAAGAALILWLPPVTAFCRAMTGPARATGRLALDRTPVAYGPQTLIGN